MSISVRISMACIVDDEQRIFIAISFINSIRKVLLQRHLGILASVSWIVQALLADGVVVFVREHVF